MGGHARSGGLRPGGGGGIAAIAAASVAIGLAFLGAGCGRGPEAELALLYNASAQYHRPDRNPIIAIPGILGSRLVHTPSGTVAWGAFEPGAVDPADPDDARVIALPLHGDAPLASLRDEVVPDGVLERVRIRLVGVPLEVQAYAGILATLGAGGYRDRSLGLGGQIDYGDDHFTCFQFAYDWRRDNVENARRLAAFIAEKRAAVRAQWRARYGVDVPQVKFDIAAHSMGGLLTRYFLMYGGEDLPADGSLPQLTWAGARDVERVILVGPPNAGSASALLQLVQGRRMGPLLPFYPPALMGTFPSVYQLLPRSRHRPALWDGDPERPVDDLLDPALWERLGWGLAAADQTDDLAVLLPDVRGAAARRRVALAYQRRVLERARAFMRALDRPAQAPDGLEVFLVAGDALDTPQTVAVGAEDGRVALVASGPGDGTVLRSSALLDERGARGWRPRVDSPLDLDRVLLLPDGHLGLTRNPVFRDNVLFWLLEQPR